MNIFILEDQWVEQVNLEKIINEIAQEEKIPVSSLNAYSKIAEFKKHLPAASVDNVYLLDLEVDNDKQAGLKLSRYVRKNDPYATIIFITVHDELLPVTFKYQAEALDFIAKDQDNIKERLTRALKTVRHKPHSFPLPTILLKIGTGYTRINIDDIICFTPNPANSHQSFLHLVKNQQITVHGSLTTLEKKSPLFFRSHRRCLINASKVKEINTHKHKVILTGGEELPLSRLKNSALLTQLAKFTDTRID